MIGQDAGVYKVVFSNEKGSDETSGKMTVKEVGHFLEGRDGGV